jgi:hypothetical protein
MSYIPEEPQDENEAYENLDESLDELDLPGHGGGPEGGRDVEDLVVDREALRELGADLDDPERIALLDGGMDDPDGVELPRRSPPGAAGDEIEPGGVPGLEIVDVDATEMDQVPDDEPGAL